MSTILGQRFFNNKNQEFEVIDIQDDVYYCEFVDTKYIAKVKIDAIRKGALRDRLSPSLYDIGIIGYVTSKPDNTRQYSIWCKMISRCYNVNDKDYHLYGGNYVTVCDRWHRFDYFVHDLPLVDGYDDILFHSGQLQLDKDLKQHSLIYKVYSRETCTFISKTRNIQLAWNVPTVAINNDNIIYGDSLRELHNKIDIGTSVTTLYRRRCDGKSIHGYNIMYNPARFVPATINPCKEV